MKVKLALKKVCPRFLRLLYNRFVSKHLIQKTLGAWFNINWKEEALSADERTWIDTYDTAWSQEPLPDLSTEDLKRISALIDDHSSILDAGCGDGYLLEFLCQKSNCRTGLDLSRTALKLAHKRLSSSIPLIQGFIEALPFADDSFDVVICTHTLEHIKNLAESISELKRITNKQLIILVPSQEYLPYTMDYHLHFFPQEKDLLGCLNDDKARIERYTIPPGECIYQGDVLLMTLQKS